MHDSEKLSIKYTGTVRGKDRIYDSGKPNDDHTVTLSEPYERELSITQKIHGLENIAEVICTLKDNDSSLIHTLVHNNFSVSDYNSPFDGALEVPRVGEPPVEAVYLAARKCAGLETQDNMRSSGISTEQVLIWWTKLDEEFKASSNYADTIVIKGLKEQAERALLGYCIGDVENHTPGGEITRDALPEYTNPEFDRDTLLPDNRNMKTNNVIQPEGE